MNNDMYDIRIAALKDLAARHNAKLADDAPARMDADAIITHLTAQGALTVEALDALTVDDLPPGMLSVVKRSVMSALRSATGNEIVRQECSALPLSGAPAQPPTIHFEMPALPAEMTDAALLKLYNPELSQPRYDDVLRARYGNTAVIAPAADLLTVDVEATLTRMRLAAKGRQLTPTVMLGNPPRPVRARMIGESLQRDVQREDPLSPGSALDEPGEACPETGESWVGISLAARQIVWLAVKTGELTDPKREVIMAARTGGELEMGRRYRNAAAALADMSEPQRPSLELSAALAVNARPEGRHGVPFRDGSLVGQAAYRLPR